jgi:hypothetical protein
MRIHGGQHAWPVNLPGYWCGWCGFADGTHGHDCPADRGLQPHDHRPILELRVTERCSVCGITDPWYAVPCYQRPHHLCPGRFFGHSPAIFIEGGTLAGTPG